ncbi:hypothetical protein LIER_36434 [Lithospermum erythrorhizon]|uniref:Uncharacterized protein n=1 Tax=Lithospermum erythrorhizon TaxID=34254 RepID=A0AAV3P5Y4_LITER
MLVRPISIKSIMEDMSGTYKFSREGYGSVKKVYIVCKQDKAMTEDFQRWQIENEQNVTEVMEIIDADHMPMLCKPQHLSQLLLEIADKYS